MLNLKEAAVLLKTEGIAHDEQDVIRWILDGKLKAKRTKSLNIDYVIEPIDLAAFMIEKLIEKRIQKYGVDYLKWEKTFSDNKRLKEENEELKAKIRIEQTKVRGLKRMLQAEYALSEEPSPLTYVSLLGLDANADKEIIKKEFKKILKALHPDRGGDERLFRVFYEHYDKAK
ncbi:J domain-containing protein [Neobacillus mesonae]|uniref:J domain-containing protein n=1 Tax=Neobacillus mesonae TaxID=1193713 RepID=UPI00203F77AE|nr:J domain-containing protein [Neobacillus mesonae]MCM3570845.1 J domain-containing protein [Neobacillus mesonae]